VILSGTALKLLSDMQTHCLASVKISNSLIKQLIPIAARFKGAGLRPLASGIEGSNAARYMDVCLL
jgi:hypothetical protein